MINQVLVKTETKSSMLNSSERFRRKSTMRQKKTLTHIIDFPEGYSHILIPLCNFCHLEFRSLHKWQAHFITFVHKVPFPSLRELKINKEEALIVCKLCGQDVVVNFAKEHRCLIAEEAKIENHVQIYNQIYMPIICVLCKKIKVFPSQAYLQIHLLTIHSPTKDPYRCNICNAKFKTSNAIVHEEHALDVHGPELNLIYWRLLGEHMAIKTKTEDIKYVCALSHFSKINDKKIVCCIESISDIFQLTLHTLCHHGYLPAKTTKDKIKILKKKKETDFYKEMLCKYCGESLNSMQTFTDHILSSHLHGIMIRKDFIIRKGYLFKNVPFSHTCITCLTIFQNTVDLQIHIMVNHGTEEFGLCGICGENLLHFNDGKDEYKIDRIHWKTIKHHETLHLRQILSYKENGIFDSSLKESPKLYLSDKEFADELEARKNVAPGPLFNAEQLTFLTLLGQRNYETQVNMEINDR